MMLFVFGMLLCFTGYAALDARQVNPTVAVTARARARAAAQCVHTASVHTVPYPSEPWQLILCM